MRGVVERHGFELAFDRSAGLAQLCADDPVAQAGGDSRTARTATGITTAVYSPKGGMGTTTVAVNLAVALAGRGSRVGIIDGDMYGPNIPIMLGLRTPLETDGQKIRPAERYGLQVVSMGFLTDDDAPVIWRGPMIQRTIQQFISVTDWGALDLLLVDLAGVSAGSLDGKAEALQAAGVPVSDINSRDWRSFAPGRLCPTSRR